MQLQIQLKLNEPLYLPLAYHGKLKGAIYSLGRDPENDDSPNLHDEGFQRGKREYRPFCYSLLNGPHKVDKENKTITFFRHVSFEVRSIHEPWLSIVERNAAEQGVRLGEKVYGLEYMQRGFAAVFSNQISFTMASPVTVHRTDPKTRRTHFISPEDEAFRDLINGNFRRKYEAYIGRKPEGNVQIRCLDTEHLKKYSTLYEGFQIDAWMGKFSLQGDPEYLSFLYDTGIGARNPTGFGMMKVI